MGHAIVFVIIYVLMHCPPALVWEDPPACRDLAQAGYVFASMVECEDYVRHPPAVGRFYCAEIVQTENQHE
jgi:hypothetical protein